MKTLGIVKKNYIFGMVMIIAFASCGSKKTMVQNKMLEPPINNRPIPCYDEAKDDGQYYRALGTGRHRVMQFSRSVATLDAEQQLMAKLSDIKQKLSDNAEYGNIIREFADQLNISYDYANRVCEKMTSGKDQAYTAYVVLEVSKEEIRQSIIYDLNRISNQQQLGIDFNEEDFVKYLNEIMEIN